MANGSSLRDCLRDNLDAVLDDMASERPVDDYGLMEALCVDMLSEEETRDFAERLEKCEYSRRECAAMFASGTYEGTPFADRMKNYASETDAAWKKIAATFDPSLEAKASVAEAARTVSREENAPRVRSRADVRDANRTVLRQLALCASAALLGGVVVATPSYFFPNSPLDAKALFGPQETQEGAKGMSGTKTIAAPANDDAWTPEPETLRMNISVEQANAALKKLEDRRAAPKESLIAALTSGEDRFNEAVYRGALAFKAGRFAEAAKSFGEAVKEKSTDEDARWNWAVATAKSGDVEGARKIFEAWNAASPSQETKNRVENALNYWRVDGESQE